MTKTKSTSKSYALQGAYETIKLTATNELKQLKLWPYSNIIISDCCLLQRPFATFKGYVYVTIGHDHNHAIAIDISFPGFPLSPLSPPTSRFRRFRLSAFPLLPSLPSCTTHYNPSLCFPLLPSPSPYIFGLFRSVFRLCTNVANGV